MSIQGLQKLTLLDFPGQVACTVFLGGCNFRCPFCHNASLVLEPGQETEITQEELLAFLKKRQGVLDGVCVTGGEPLLWPKLPELLQKIKALGYQIKLDTNGSRPELLRQLVQEGLVDYVAMDIKAGPQNYAHVAGVPGLDLTPIEQSVAFLKSGAVKHEFRTTVVSPLHTGRDFEEIGHWLQGEEHYFLQGFVDSGALMQNEGLAAYTKEEMEEFLELVQKNIPHAALRGID